MTFGIRTQYDTSVTHQYIGQIIIHPPNNLTFAQTHQSTHISVYNIYHLLFNSTCKMGHISLEKAHISSSGINILLSPQLQVNIYF